MRIRLLDKKPDSLYFLFRSNAQMCFFLIGTQKRPLSDQVYFWASIPFFTQPAIVTVLLAW